MELYKSVASLTESAECGKSYKSKLFSIRNKKNIKSLHSLSVNCVKKRKIIDQLLQNVGISDITWLKRVILYEFIWGRRTKILNLQPNAVINEIFKHRLEILKNLHHIEKETITEGETEVPRYIRINSEKLTREKCELILKENNFQFISCPETYENFLKQVNQLKINEYMFDYHIPNLLVFNHSAKLQKFSLNNFIRQDKSSCLVVPLLAPLPGSSILDMCAAPGYKTQHAASYISKLGKIYSVDIHKGRFSILNNTIKQFALDNCCEALNKDALKITEDFCPNVEYIILDAPCSGTGMSNSLIKHIASEERLRKLHNIQVMLLKHALKNFSCVRRIVYSTCAVTEEENEEVVSECLEVAQEQGFHLVPLASTFKGSFQSGRGSHNCSPYVIRTSPKLDLTNGFFIAVFERSVPPKLPDWKNCINRDNNSIKANDQLEDKDIAPVNLCPQSDLKNSMKQKTLKSGNENKKKKIRKIAQLENNSSDESELTNEGLKKKSLNADSESKEAKLKSLANKKHNKTNSIKKTTFKKKSGSNKKLKEMFVRHIV